MSSGDQYGGGEWGQQDDDPWGQGAPPMPEQGGAWISPTQEWESEQGGQPGGGSWDTGPPPAGQGWNTGPAQWDTAMPGGMPPGGGQPTYEAGPGGYDPNMPPPQQGYDPNMPPPGWAPGGPPPMDYGAPPPKKSNKGLIIGLSCAGGGVLVLILVIVLVVALTGNDSGKGGNGKDGNSAAAKKVAWTVPEPDDEDASDTVSTFASADKESLLRVSGAGITAHSLSSGKQKWDIGAPEGQKVCSGTRSAPDGVAAIVYGADRHCSTVAAIDVSTGKQLWSTSLKPRNEDIPPSDAAVDAGGGKIWVSNSEQVWRFDAKKSPDDVKPGRAWPKDEFCSVGDIRYGAKGLLTTMRCSSKTELVALSNKSMKTLWHSKVDSDDISMNLVSANPPTLQVGNASDNGELRVFDDKGKQKHVIQSRGDGGSLQLQPAGFSTSDLRKDFNLKLVGNSLITLAKEGESSESTQSIVSVDLTTGQRAWTKKISKKEQYSEAAWVDNADPKKGMILDPGSYDTKPQLREFDPAKKGAMKAGEKLDNGKSSSTRVSSYSTKVLSIGKNLVMVNSNPSDDQGLITGYK